MKEEETFGEQKPYWQYQECGHTDTHKPIPKDRKKWYGKGKANICPKCKSESFIPVGY